MRANVEEYEILSPPTLADALAILADGLHTPICGGTELMVALAAGRLPSKPLVSIRRFKELRFIDVQADAIVIGAGTTFTDLRKHPIVASDFWLLAQAASWTGSIANQNRGTIGGNIVNASPAADSLPALLVYDAELKLISARGVRVVPYREFHQGYKKTVLGADELLLSIKMYRIYNKYVKSIRKVGTRNAQAVSKVALAVLARIENHVIEDVRIAGASLRDIPLRLAATEEVLRGNRINDETIALARSALVGETRPLDDVRSTAQYRSIVAANLLEDFLRTV